MTVSTDLSPLAQIQALLNELAFPNHLLTPSADMPFPQLLVSLDQVTDPNISLYVMQIMSSEDLLQVQPAEAPPTTTLQFYMELPMSFASDRLLDTYRLVSAYSKLLPLGSLNINEQSGLFYHYAWATARAGLSLATVVEILETAQFFLTLCVPKVQEFQVGATDLAAVLETTEADWGAALERLGAQS
jgi:hypothetical protein